MIRIDLLGKFQISDEIETIGSGYIKSDMLEKLLSFLIINRNRAMTAQELAENLWQEEETENPIGALKNLMYRLRKFLKKEWGDKEYIVSAKGTRGYYQWNSDIDVEVDVELFEINCKEANDNKSVAESIKCLEAAISLYRGDFLVKHSDLYWIIPLSSYYRSLFLSSVKVLSELYIEEKRYQDAEKLCSRALTFDLVDEGLHIAMITSLIRQDKRALATEYYERAEKILYEAFGIRGTKGMLAIQKELLAMTGGNESCGIREMQDDMQEESETEGAYVCGYAVFKAIYRLEARKIARLGLAEYILLITLRLKNVSQEEEPINKAIKKKSIKTLEKVVRDSLRIGDVMSQYSDTQIVALLPTCSFESSAMISERIKENFYSTANKQVRISIEIEEVTMIDPFSERGK